MNENIIVPDYVKNAMNTENEIKKKYGTTVFDYIPEKDEETITNDFFKKDEYDTTEIEKQREELKETYDGSKINEVISKDALSGITSSVPQTNTYSEEDYNKLNKSLEENNIRGKSISKYGKSLIKSLINDDPTDEETLLLATKFEEYKDKISSDKANESRFNELTVEEINEFLSDRIKNQIEALCDSEKYKDIASRFLEQIYITYQNTVSYRDDIKELNDLALEIDKSGILSEDVSTTSDPKSFDFMNEKISKYMEAIKRLDNRNKMLKQDYKITDIDTLTLESAKACLDDAINFTQVKNKVDNATKKFRIDLKSAKDTDSSIDNWIHDIKHDSTTLFTFPCNDFLSDEESREELVRFFYNSYLVDIVYNENIDVPADEDIDDYLIDNDIVTEDDLEILRDKAYVMLYTISRTFKYNKVKDNDNNIRTLSYTLDIISKLGVKSHRDKFIEASDYVYDKLYN